METMERIVSRRQHVHQLIRRRRRLASRILPGQHFLEPQPGWGSGSRPSQAGLFAATRNPSLIIGDEEHMRNGIDAVDSGDLGVSVLSVTNLRARRKSKRAPDDVLECSFPACPEQYSLLPLAMNISIILAHPHPGSFNHAIAATAAETLRQNSHAVRLHDLCAEQFDPLMPAAEFARDVQLEEVVAHHCEEIVNADGIIVVHPNWWAMPPAILKGWLDRVLRPEVAYRFEAGKSIGLLKAQTAIVFNTSNTPAELERALYDDPLETLWKKCVFSLCGVPLIHRRLFSVIITSTPEQRAAWLAEVRQTVAGFFPTR